MVMFLAAMVLPTAMSPKWMLAGATVICVVPVHKPRRGGNDGCVLQAAGAAAVCKPCPVLAGILVLYKQ
jgi:hypothetical protein